jgi:sugar lactone lactonase YvrE
MYGKWILAATASLTIAAMPLTASARNSYQERWHDESSGVVDWCRVDSDRFVWTADVSGNLTIVPRGDGLIYFNEAVTGTVVWTDSTSGKSLTRSFATNSHDLAVVDNGDGTLTITTQGAGSDLYFDSDGRLVLSNNGMVRWSVLIDHGGTPDDPSDDEFIADLGIVKPSTGTNDTEGRDFCDDLVTFTA